MIEHRPATATSLLREEHELILRVARALDEMFVAASSTGKLDFDNVARCVSFFRLFADACHHGKEEDLLFPALGVCGLPLDGGPIAVMLYEHEEGRRFVAEMAAAVEGARGGDEGEAEKLGVAAGNFVTLINAHISKENNVLFDMADQLIEGAACEELCASYEALADEQFEGHTKSDLQGLAAEILATQPTST